MPDMPDHPNLNCLVELANRDGVDIRPTLLRVTTDLYVQKLTHSADEDQHFTELALRLFDLVDARTRAIVAEKIAAHPNAPAAVRRRVLGDGAAPAEPAKSTPNAAEACTGRSAGAEELTELFFASNAEERRLILANLPYAPLAPAPPIAARPASEAIERLEAAALGHNSERFARELHHALAITLPLARRILDDPLGEPIVVAAVSLGMPAFVLQRILLCLSASISQSVQRVYDLALLQDELAPEAALRMLAIWQADRRVPDGLVAQPTPSPRNRPHLPVIQHQEGKAALGAAAPFGRPRIGWDQQSKSRKERA
jgi:hypothetical protein